MALLALKSLTKLRAPSHLSVEQIISYVILLAQYFLFDFSLINHILAYLSLEWIYSRSLW